MFVWSFGGDVGLGIRVTGLIRKFVCWLVLVFLLRCFSLCVRN